MEITLTNQIVILDEAHNIEDSSREAASFAVSQSQLLDAMHDLETIGHCYYYYYFEILFCCDESLMQWVVDCIIKAKITPVIWNLAPRR